MTRSRLYLSGLLAAIALFALPAGAQAQSAPAYSITGAGGTLTASNASTLAVQVRRLPGPVEGSGEVTFTPAAVAAGLPAGCDNATPGVTTCDEGLLATQLILDSEVLEINVDAVITDLLTLNGGGQSDSMVVDGPAPTEPSFIDRIALAPGDGADTITVSGDVLDLTLVGADPGNDRYTISSIQPSIGDPSPGEDLNLGAGNDVITSAAPNLRINGGADNDTLIGANALVGGDGDDVIKPTRIGQVADGGNDAGTSDSLSYELVTTGQTFTKLGPGDVQITGDGGAGKTGFERVDGTKGNDIMIGHPGFDLLGGGEGDDTFRGSGGSDVLDGGPGDNTISYATGASPVVVDLAAGTASAGGTDSLTAFRQVVTGPGNDVVTGSSASEVFSLNAGVDTVNAGPGNDIINGGPGNDALRGGSGQDSIEGGADTDTVTYDERTASEPISVTLATPGGDGAAGENDTLTGIEDVVGGASNDTLVGDDGPNTLIGGPGLNTLDGGAGNDVLRGAESRDIITGGPGSDQLFGEGDDDSLNAYDNESDVVDCGPSADDDAQVDAGDSVTGCEFSRRADVPVPVDADGDGFIASFDCNDNNASIKPGAIDIVEDGIDQNCDGFDELIAYVDFGLEVSFSQPTKAQVRAKKRGRRISRFVVTELPPRSQVRVACSVTRLTKRRFPKACPFKSKTRKLTGRSSQVSMTTSFRKRLLPPGTTIELRITAPGFNGKVRRFTVRAASVRDQSLCIPRGKTRASRCPADEE